MHNGPVDRPRKIDTLRRLIAAGDWRRALRLAAAFPRLGDHAVAIRRGWSAASNPDFYRQIGKNPDALVAAGIAALRERYAA